MLQGHTSHLEDQLNVSYANAPVKGEWLHRQKEKRERLRARNQEYLDKLRFMISYRESKITEKIQ